MGRWVLGHGAGVNVGAKQIGGCGEVCVGVMWEGVRDGFRLWSM